MNNKRELRNLRSLGAALAVALALTGLLVGLLVWPERPRAQPLAWGPHPKLLDVPYLGVQAAKTR